MLFLWIVTFFQCKISNFLTLFQGVLGGFLTLFQVFGGDCAGLLL